MIWVVLEFQRFDGSWRPYNGGTIAHTINYPEQRLVNCGSKGIKLGPSPASRWGTPPAGAQLCRRCLRGHQTAQTLVKGQPVNYTIEHIWTCNRCTSKTRTTPDSCVPAVPNTWASVRVIEQHDEAAPVLKDIVLCTKCARAFDLWLQQKRTK